MLITAAWRTDAAQSGEAGCPGDIGTHAFNLAKFVTSLRCESVAAELPTFVPGRRLDDNVQLLLRFQGGALWSSQVAPGHENGLRLRVYGERGGLDWAQKQPNHSLHSPSGEPPSVIRCAGAGASAVAAHASRIPSGHPEGYLEAFAQLYRDFADQLEAVRNPGAAKWSCLLNVTAGLRDMQFVSAAIASSRDDARWRTID